MDSNQQRFVDLVAPGSGGINGSLDLGALLLAAVIDPQVDPDAELRRLDALADRSGADNLTELLAFLFGPGGFSGARDDYYNADNSYLNRLLDRRQGIPISLAVLTIEVGRRRGIHIEGVGMPGHFLVRADGHFVDVFGGGVLLDDRGCAQLLERMAGKPVVLAPDALDATPPGDILKRMLLNLKMIGERNKDVNLYRMALLLLTCYPEATTVDLLALAQSMAAGAQFDQAATIAERALERIPEARRETIENQITLWRARLN